MRDWKLKSWANDAEISAVPFRKETEDCLWRRSTICEQLFQKSTVPFDFQPKFPEFFLLNGKHLKSCKLKCKIIDPFSSNNIYFCKYQKADEKKKKRRGANLEELNSAHRHSQSKCQLVQTRYIQRIKLFLSLPYVVRLFDYEDDHVRRHRRTLRWKIHKNKYVYLLTSKLFVKILLIIGRQGIVYSKI